MKHIKKFETFTLSDLTDSQIKELEYYKRDYSRYWDNRLEEDFIKIIKGYPIKITDYDNRDEVSEEMVLPLKNNNDTLYYKAYITPEKISENPDIYDFVAPMWRDKDTLNWIKHKIKNVKNLDNNTLGGLAVTLKDGGGSNLGSMFLVNYTNTGY